MSNDFSWTAGFTLLELLMVITILSAVAWMAIGTIETNTDQVRFEDTRNRLSAIRRAIIGDTSRTLNGMPEIRGYVADMGNLPPNLNALLTKDYCSDPQYTEQSDCTDAGETWYVQGAPQCSDPQYFTESACTGAGYTWTEEGRERCESTSYDNQTDCEDNGYKWLDGSYHIENIYESYDIWTGWNGPYLNAAELKDYSKFRDGWGNKDSTPSNNFGWIYTLGTSPTLDLTVTSLGMDGTSDAAGGGTGDYESDYPPSTAQSLIKDAQYRILITDSKTTSRNDDDGGGLIVDFDSPAPCWRCTDSSYNTRDACEGATPTAGTWYADSTITDSGTCTDSAGANGSWEPTESLCMKIAIREEGRVNTATELVSSGTNGNQALTWNGNPKSVLFSFEDSEEPDYDEDTYIPYGQLAYRIYEYDSSATDPCTDTEYPLGSEWKTFSFVPGSVIQPLRWEVE